MISPVTITCVLFCVFVVCRSSSQNRLARRIGSLQRAFEGLRDDFSAERIKQQQLISEITRTLKDEQDRRKILERQIAEVGGRLNSKVTVPVLRFTQAYGDDVVIEANGAVARDANPDGPALWTTVRTDGLLTADRRHYWEVELSWSPRSDPGDSGWRTVGAAALRLEGSDFSGTLGYDKLSWAVWIQYHFGINKWVYACFHDSKSIFLSKRVTYTNSEAISRMGFLLPASAQKNLTVIDVGNNASLCSFELPSLDGSKPLVPAVRFGNDFFQRGIRLTTFNPSPHLLHN